MTSAAESLLPPPLSRPLAMSVLIATALTGVWALVGMAVGWLGAPAPSWTFIGFELVTLVAAALGIPVALNRVRTGPALALLCIAGAIGASAVLEYLGANRQVTAVSVKLWTMGRLAVAGLLLAIIFAAVLPRRRGATATLGAGIALALPVLAISVATMLTDGRLDGLGLPGGAPPAHTQSVDPFAPEYFEPAPVLTGSTADAARVLRIALPASLALCVALAGMVLLRRPAGRAVDPGVRMIQAGALIALPAATVGLYLLTNGRPFQALGSALDVLRLMLIPVSAGLVGAFACASGHLVIRAFEMCRPEVALEASVPSDAPGATPPTTPPPITPGTRAMAT